MRRRDFIQAITGSAVVWPLAVRAQQSAMPVIGYLYAGSPESSTQRVAAFRKGLNEAGYREGENVAIEFRWANDQTDRLPELAADLIRRRVAVIATPGSTPASLAAKAATTTIPIVFGIGSDPVQEGLVTSLARPGGNVTGVAWQSGELGAKRLALLHELLPKAMRVVLLVNPNNPLTAPIVADVQTAAPSRANRSYDGHQQSRNRFCICWLGTKTDRRAVGRCRRIISRASHTNCFTGGALRSDCDLFQS